MGEALDWQASQKDNGDEREHFWSSQLGLPCAETPAGRRPA
jgi:hypothetical protein